MEALYFYVWRLSAKRLNRREPGNPKSRLPRFRHKELSAAMTEAERLSGLFPESRFVILAAVAEVGPAQAQEAA